MPVQPGFFTQVSQNSVKSSLKWHYVGALDTAIDRTLIYLKNLKKHLAC